MPVRPEKPVSEKQARRAVAQRTYQIMFEESLSYEEAESMAMQEMQDLLEVTIR